MCPGNLSLRAELVARRLWRLSLAPLVLWNSIFNSVVRDYLELAQGCSMRICPELEKKFPDFHGKQLELMMYLCFLAYNSEIDDGLCDDAWMRTTITLKDDHLSSNPGKLGLMAELCWGTPMCQSNWDQLKEKEQENGNGKGLTSRIGIRSNILPRRAYWERLQKLQRQWNRTRVQSSLLWRTPCSSGREFIPVTVIGKARQEGSSFKEKVDEWRTNGGSCDLTTHLQTSVVRPTARRPSLRTIEAFDVEWMRILGRGSAATVHEVSWRNGTYAMKSFESSVFDMKFNERHIAEEVLHPHIVRSIGYFENRGKCHLLMEMLDTNLEQYVMLNTRLGKSPFSRQDTLDVLLQIASAVKHLHDNCWVHGDLKTNNIVLSSFEILGNGRHFLAKVKDFGDAQIIEPKQLFRPAGDGTTRFAAPELLERRLNRKKDGFDYPKAIDVYSFGGVAHEVLTGYSVYSERKRNNFTSDFVREVIAGKVKPSGPKNREN